MSVSKYFDAICLIVIVFAVGLTVAFMNGERLGLETARAAGGYESRLFDTSRVHRIDIVMDDFDDLCRRADKNAWFSCTAVIDGEKYSNISIRVKGNAGEIESSGNIKYSFKIEFDHTNNIENYHGLDKLDLNNFAGDCTYMKDFMVYEMMGAAGVPAPLASYAYLTVNGKDIGLYLAVESVEDAFLLRNFGVNSGNLYKPSCDETVYVRTELSVGREPGIDESGSSIIGRTEENSGRDVTFADPAAHIDPAVLGGGSAAAAGTGQTGGAADAGAADAGISVDDMSEADTVDASTSDDSVSDTGGQGDPASSDGQTDGAGGADSSEADGQEDLAAGDGQDSSESTSAPIGHDAYETVRPDDIKLKYIDDDPESYPNIFAHSMQDVTDRDRRRLVDALKTLNTEEDVRSAVDTDEVIAYFAVHNFVVSFNSYTGESAENYYLYEKDGKLSMLPWDYSSTFGTYRSQDAGRMVNYPIDTPLMRGLSGERPMFDWIMKDQGYVTAYHAALKSVAAYAVSGDGSSGVASASSEADSGSSKEVSGSSGEVSTSHETSRAASRIRQIEEMITPYVEKDPHRFSSETAFHKGVSTLISFLDLRSRSVLMQLGGEIPSTYDGQTADLNTLIDASSIELIDMK